MHPRDGAKHVQKRNQSENPSRASGVGPLSKDRRIIDASLDRRSKVGRLFRTTVADLTAHIGGDPTPAQSLLIQSAALKAARLYLLSEKLLDGGDLSEGSDHHALAWLNSMRIDLTTLGLKRQIKDGPSLNDILRGHVDDESEDAEAAE
jgi:hypothetical protein